MNNYDVVNDLITSVSSFHNDEKQAILDRKLILTSPEEKVFLICKSVLSNLELLRYKTMDWSLFKDLEGESTYILPNNEMLRARFYKGYKHLIFIKGNSDNSELDYSVFSVKDVDGEYLLHCSDKVNVDFDYIYRILLFIYFSEREEVLLKPKEKHGTNKSGKIINTTSNDLIYVTSRWNKTVVSSPFSVKGHMAIRRVGEKRSGIKIVYIEPYIKRGYKREY